MNVIVKIKWKLNELLDDYLFRFMQKKAYKLITSLFKPNLGFWKKKHCRVQQNTRPLALCLSVYNL